MDAAEVLAGAAVDDQTGAERSKWKEITRTWCHSYKRGKIESILLSKVFINQSKFKNKTCLRKVRILPFFT